VLVEAVWTGWGEATLKTLPPWCTIRLQIDEIDAADSLQEAEDIWLPVLEALQQLVNPGSLPEAGTKARSGSDNSERAWYLIPGQA
jgi:hypothetical protein